MSHIEETTDSLLVFVPLPSSYKNNRNSIENDRLYFAFATRFTAVGFLSCIANCIK